MTTTFKLGDGAVYTRGYQGCFAAEVVGYDGDRLVVEFYSGLRITVHPSELEMMDCPPVCDRENGGKATDREASLCCRQRE